MDDVYQIMIPRARLFLWLVRVSHQCLFAISRVPIKGDLTSILNDTKSQYKFERNVCPTYYSRQQYPRGRVPTGANEPLLILLLPISKARPNRLTHVEQSRRPPVCSLRDCVLLVRPGQFAHVLRQPPPELGRSCWFLVAIATRRDRIRGGLRWGLIRTR